MLSTHEMTLFLAANSNQPHGRASRTVIEEIRNRRLEILLIDDDEEWRDSLSYRLKTKYGAIVTSVDSGRVGIDLVIAGKIFNVIFLDLKMPDLDGLKTYHELRQSNVACRIVVMSAHRQSPEWKEAEELDLELVEKPIAPARLDSILSEQ